MGVIQSTDHEQIAHCSQENDNERTDSRKTKHAAEEDFGRANRLCHDRIDNLAFDVGWQTKAAEEQSQQQHHVVGRRQHKGYIKSCRIIRFRIEVPPREHNGNNEHRNHHKHFLADRFFDGKLCDGRYASKGCLGEVDNKQLTNDLGNLQEPFARPVL